jgi:hypothetical protein
MLSQRYFHPVCSVIGTLGAFRIIVLIHVTDYFIENRNMNCH